MLVVRAIFLVARGPCAVDLSEPAETEVYFAASQQICGTSGVRFFVDASDWEL